MMAATSRTSLFSLRSLLLNFLTTATLLLPSVVLAQTCQTITPTYPAPVMGSGYQSRIMMNGLKTPRGIIFDTEGNLLVVEQGGGGIRYIKLTDNGGLNVCVASSKQLINDNTLNHGIALSVDGRTLYVSSLDNVYSYPYDPAAGTVGTRTQIISTMRNGGAHLTRTLLVPKNSPNLLLVQRGSDGNIDSGTTDVNSGRSQIRIFDTTKLTSAVAYSTNGEVLGWGLRNSVGFGEDPTTGGIWSVENSCDDMQRLGKDVHQTNPGEEMNYHGLINNTAAPERGANYGYPICFAAWDPSVLPTNANIKVGTQFLIGNPSGSNTDALCSGQRQAPRLTFGSHTAPLDIKFKPDGSAAYISFHGSWDRQPPDGYRVSRIDFVNGQPKEPSTSTTAAINVMSNQNTANCPGRCFRPVGLAFDSKGRLFMASDSTGEIHIITGA